MTDSNYTHLLTIVDRSGSMNSIKNDMIGALNTLFKDQSKEDGKCLVDYVQFDDEYELVFSDVPVAEAKAQLEPRRMTALNDAIGKGVTDLGKKLAAMDEDKRPGNVIVAVVTDGGENASREFTVEAVKALVEKQEKEYNWAFTFLGANMDAVSTGASYGFSPAMSMTYDVHNTGMAGASLSSNITRTRGGDRSGYSKSERESAVK